MKYRIALILFLWPGVFVGMKNFVWPPDVINNEPLSELQENMFSEANLALANPLDGMK